MSSAGRAIDSAWARREPLDSSGLASCAEELYLASVRANCLEAAPGYSDQDTHELRLKLVLLEYARNEPLARELNDSSEWINLPEITALPSRDPSRDTLKLEGEITMLTTGTTMGVSTRYQWGPYFHQLERVINSRILSVGYPHLRLDGKAGTWPPKIVPKADFFELLYDRDRAESESYESVSKMIAGSGDWGSINFITADAAFSVCLQLSEEGFKSEANVDFAETKCYEFMRDTIESVFAGTVNDNARVWDSGFTFRSSRSGELEVLRPTCDYRLGSGGEIFTVNLWNLSCPTVNYWNGDRLVSSDSGFRMARDEYQVCLGEDLEALGRDLFSIVGGKFQVSRDKNGVTAYLPKNKDKLSNVASRLGESYLALSDLPIVRGDARVKVHTFFVARDTALSFRRF